MSLRKVLFLRAMEYIQRGKFVNESLELLSKAATSGRPPLETWNVDTDDDRGDGSKFTGSSRKQLSVYPAKNQSSIATIAI